ncbi:hypothetical protein ACFL10_01470 [Patescibacteria group bacterium]
MIYLNAAQEINDSLKPVAEQLAGMENEQAQEAGEKLGTVSGKLTEKIGRIIGTRETVPDHLTLSVTEIWDGPVEITDTIQALLPFEQSAPDISAEVRKAINGLHSLVGSVEN